MTRGIDGGTALVLALLLSGCAGGSVKHLSSVEPVCTALMGPLKYNSTVKASRRFAGPDLVPDLKKRNQVGRNLRCPNYK